MKLRLVFLIFILGIIILPIFEGFNVILFNLQPTNFMDKELTTSSSSSLYEFDWYRTIGGLYEDDCRGVAVDNDDNVYVVGGQYITETDRDIIIIKYDPFGTQQWVEYWGGSNYEFGYDLVFDDLNNLYIVGFTKSKGDVDGDVIVLKYNSNGEEQWNFTWGGSDMDIAAGIDKDSMFNYYITGTTRSFGDTDGDAFLVKFNSNWEEQWNVTWGGTLSDESADVLVDSDNIIYISGITNGGEGDAFLLKYNSAGTLQWQRTWGTSYAQIFSGIATDSAHNIYGVGMTFGHPASSGKGLIVKYDLDGTYQWERIWGVNGVYSNYMYRIIIDANDDLYIAGLTYSYGIPNNHDAILFNYDTSGNQLWYKTWATNDWDITTNLCIDSNSNIYMTGNTKSNSVGDSDILVLKYSYAYTNQDIQIMTPENTTYTAPMSGYYPATYGFENDAIGEYPFNWVVDESGGQIEIVEEVDSHLNVLQLHDNSASDYIVLNNSILRTSGTVEFWMRVAQKTTGMFTYIVDDLSHGIHFYVQENGYFTYWDGIGVRNNIEPYNANQWYHIKIEFDIINWHLWIDGIKKDADGFDFYGAPTTFKKVGFSSWVPGTGYLYIDAIGYSWDPHYVSGDNLNEGLLLSFQTLTPLEWMAYYLDYSANHTIHGDTVIPMPSSGVHSIKVIGLDTLDEIHQSALRVFSIDDLPPTPPDIPPYDNLVMIIFTIIGIMAFIGVTLTTILIVKTKPRKIAPPYYNPSIRTEERYYQQPIRENFPPNNRLIQCPNCLIWDEMGGNYCPNCGSKLPKLT